MTSRSSNSKKKSISKAPSLFLLSRLFDFPGKTSIVNNQIQNYNISFFVVV